MPPCDTPVTTSIYEDKDGPLDTLSQRPNKTKADVNDYKSLNYIKIMKLSLACIGLWPYEALGMRVPFMVAFMRKMVFGEGIFVLGGTVYYMLHHAEESNFFFVGHIYITIVLEVVRSSVSFTKTYGKIVKKFVHEFHLVHHCHKSDIYEEIHLRIGRLSYYFSVISMVMMFVSAFLFNLTPAYNNYMAGVFSGGRTENTTLEFSVYLSFPGFEQHENFYTYTSINFYLSYICGFSICAFDLLLILMAFQIMGHITILRKNLSKLNFSENDSNISDSTCFNIRGILHMKMFSAEENAAIKFKLSQCIDHHREIIDFTDKMSSFFGPVLAFTYMVHLVCCCLLLLECSLMNADVIARYLGLTIVVFGELVLLSVAFEFLGTLSEQLIDAVYDMSWERMDTSNRRTVCFFLSRIQTPIQVMALGVTPVGVRTMAGILKTTLSYFAFLRSIAH